MGSAELCTKSAKNSPLSGWKPSLRSLRISVISALSVVGRIFNAEITEIRRDHREDFQHRQGLFLPLFVQSVSATQLRFPSRQEPFDRRGIKVITMKMSYQYVRFCSLKFQQAPPSRLFGPPHKSAPLIDITVPVPCHWSGCGSYLFTKINFGNAINEIERRIELGFDDCLAAAIDVTDFGSSIHLNGQSCQAVIKLSSCAGC